MRILYLFNLVTLDGFFEGLNHDITWHNVDDEFHDFAVDQLDKTDTILFGRITYQMMARYWPTPTAIKNDPIVALKMNSMSKIVFSQTLQKADWNNTRLVKENAVEEILKLKRQPGKDIAIFGSARLATTFIKSGLIDEFRIMVNPIVIGSGVPLFGLIKEKIKLKFLKTSAFKSGNVLLSYQLDKIGHQ